MRGVLFDVDGTLYEGAGLRRALARRLLGACLLHPRETPRRIRAIQSYRRAHEALRGHEGGDVEGEQLRRAADACGTSPEWVAESVRIWMEEKPLPLLATHLRPGLIPFLERLRELGVRRAVLSDYPAEEKLEALGIRGLIEVVVHARLPEVDRLKPDPRGFLHAASALGLAPEEVLYVGDRPDVDEAGARNAGMPCALVGRHGPHADFRELLAALTLTDGGLAYPNPETAP